MQTNQNQDKQPSKYQLKLKGQPQQVQTISHSSINHKSKIKKDRIFILVLVLIVASLSFDLMRTLYMMSIKNIVYSAVHVWLLVFVDVIAIIGAFWLIRSYRRTLRAQKKQQQDEENAEKGMYNE